jgi:hypothetical protein
MYAGVWQQRFRPFEELKVHGLLLPFCFLEDTMHILGSLARPPLQEMLGFMLFSLCHNIFNLHHRLTFMTPY